MRMMRMTKSCCRSKPRELILGGIDYEVILILVRYLLLFSSLPFPLLALPSAVSLLPKRRNYPLEQSLVLSVESLEASSMHLRQSRGLSKLLLDRPLPPPSLLVLLRSLQVTIRRIERILL